MGFDSTANLLFTIGANSDDAESNIQRFRQVLSKNLGDIGNETGDWAKKVFGNLSSIGGIVTAGAAAAGAAVVAMAAKVQEATKEYTDYASEVSKGMRITGLSAEEMSKLKFAAQETGVQYDSLTRGLGFFEKQIVLASQGNEKAQSAFHQLGISQKEVEAGQKDMLPLLYKVSDSFQAHANGAVKSTLSVDLFSRSGRDLLPVLNLGSEGMQRFAQHAEELGLVLTNKDIVAAKEFRAEMAALKAEQEAVNVSIARSTSEYTRFFAAINIAKLEVMRGFLDQPLKVLNPLAVMGAWSEIWEKIPQVLERIQQQVAAAKVGLDDVFEKPIEAAKAAQQQFYGVSTVLEQVRSRTAALEGPEEKAAEQVAKWAAEFAKAGTELQKLKSEGSITADSYQRELKALLGIPGAIELWAIQQAEEINKKRVEAAEKAQEELATKLESYREDSYEKQREAADRELLDLVFKLDKEQQLTEENANAIVQIRAAAENKISRAQSAAFLQEIETMQQAQAQMFALSMTSTQRLEFQYQTDLQKYSDVEKEKVLKTAQTEAERNIIETQFAANRSVLLAKYKNDLATLYNSQGWQGVFGNTFAQAIRGNEALLREWSTSANQSIMLVQVAVESLREMSQRAFTQFGQAMGQNIAQAIVYKKSIGDAMREAVASTLASIAAEAMTWAIYSTALGFIRLAQHDFPAATAAFTAAGIWASVGAVAAVAGRAIAPSQAGASSSAAGSGTAGSSGASGASTGGSSGPTPTGAVYITVNTGHIIGPSGVEQLADIINEAVQNRDVRLIATQVRQSGRSSQ